MRILSLSFVLCLQLILFLSLSYSFAFPSCRPDQSSALLDFKNSFSIQQPLLSSLSSKFCNPSLTPEISTWKNGTDCCLWDGVTCNPSGHVNELDLMYSCLHGKLLPDNSLFHLTHLQWLDLSYNDFLGSHIPSNISQLVSLTHLSLLYCNFSGEIPSHISHLHKLVSVFLFEDFNHLILRENTWERLTGNVTHIEDLFLPGVDMSSIPSSHLFKNLSSSLVTLRLQFTGLQGNLDEKLFSFPHLEEVSLYYNPNLIGYLPESNWSNSIRILDLHNTSFTGKLPNSIGQMNSLLVLDISSCKFTGEIPLSFEKLTQLTLLALSQNNFSGPISSLFKLQSLTYLDLSSNNFKYQFQYSISECKNLQHQPFLWNLTQLTTLDLSNNNFSGQISSSLFNLQNLTYLDLSSNRFTGQFPNSISGLKNLQILHLSNNEFNGTIPSWLFTLPSLNYLHLSSNQFTGSIGDISINSVKYLDVSKNKLYGPIPRSVFHLQNLTVLNFSHNFLTGDVLLQNLSWKNLYVLDLSSNFLQGELHSSICNASKLDILNLSHNNFTGTIPHCIVSSNQNLSVLDLQNNSFYGTVPESFEEGNSLRTLNLNGNFLEGPLPRSLVNCRRLKVLDLGNNGIEDVLPEWLQALEDLQVLVLRGNKLYGFIPNFKYNRSHSFHLLKVLDLSSNNLKGPLPASFFKSFEAMKKFEGRTKLEYLNNENYSNSSGGYYQDSIELTWKGLDIHLEKILTVFTSIDLSNNMLDGEIPQVVGELRSLIGLNFSHNEFTGAIPISIGNLRNLEWLDLSSNNFRGKIPIELTNLNFLSVLNLSKNQLEGCIPRGQQFETFSSNFFKGNKELRGFQLMIPCTTHEEREQTLPSSESDEFEFGWKPVALGYVCGAAFGAAMFQVVMFTGKPLWVASLVFELLKKKKKRRVRNCP